ncbi:BrnT family toxin [Sulfuriferula sp.]|nr:BrnT family toxin [Sulfuriferula sp.]MDP2026122.1 BrnT family toxin [Sulfuriferula sp.]
MNFNWDPAKAAANLRKHGVSFHEAGSVFFATHWLSLMQIPTIQSTSTVS